MAKSLVTDQGTLYIPSAVSDYTVQSQPSGLATTGVLLLVGESDAGPDYTQEADLELNAFGPDQVGDVISKYKSGPLVDAFRNATSAANDPDITGSFQACILVKTNVGVKAQSTLPKIGGGTYSVIADKSFGKLGNLISAQTTLDQAEVLPTTGLFTFIPPVAAFDYAIRVNGGARVGTNISANASPTTFQSTIDALAGVAATGGATRGLVTATGGRTIAIDAFPAGTNANTISVTISTTWDTTPVVGDTLIIPMSAPAGLRDPGAGSVNMNVGAYVITAAAASTLTAVKLSDGGRSGASAGTITAPSDTLTPIALAAATDIQAFAPVAIALEAGTVIDGIGKTLEIAALTTNTDLFSRAAYVLGTVTPVTWLSTLSTPIHLSGTDYAVTLNDSRSTDLIQEAFSVGGEIGLKLGYTGTTATVTVTATTLATTVTGGSGTNLSLTLADYPTIQDLINFVASQPGYIAKSSTAVVGALPPTALDQVTAQGICSQFATHNCHIKTDAYRFFNAVSQQSQLVQIGLPPARASAGLPDVMAAAVLLSGGTKGGSTDAAILAAVAALEAVQGNFLVPLFSRDAASDIADGLTDPASTYTIAATHQTAKSHVLAMSTLKRRRNRQAFLSIADTFVNTQEIAANIASFRCSMAFEDAKQTASDGSIQQFLPWMTATLAAAMQAAGFYRNIEYKGINTNGVLDRAGDFNPKNDSQVERALQSGLLIARQALTGGYIFVSDQTTYGKDDNFVFNSIQAVYAADTVSLTMAQRMETAFVGQSVADISAPIAKAFAETVLGDMLTLKLIAPSDDATKGFKNLTIKIKGNAMLVGVEIKLATAIDFIKIDFLVSPVQQSA